MVKTILKLKDGTEITAGQSQTNAIQKAEIIESVNDSEDLIFGSVCAKMVDVKIITPRNAVSIIAGDEIVVYEETDGIRIKKGHFTAEKPQKAGANTTRITAYDNIVKLDIDLSEWFSSLSFPKTLFEFANAVCDACGLNLANETIPNGDLLIRKSEMKEITGRQFLRWVGEACGCYCVADSDGDIEFRWYSENETQITASGFGGTIPYIGGSLKFEDYEVEEVDQIQITKGGNDVGLFYPKGLSGQNIYKISSNPFLIPTDENQEQINAVLEMLFDRIKNIKYTPFSVSVFAGTQYGVGDIINITDSNGVQFTSYVMEKRRVGQKETLKSTGNFKRNSSSAIYDASYKSNFGKTFTLLQDVNGLKIENADLKKGLSSLSLKVDGINTKVEDSEDKISEIEQIAGQVSVTVSDETGTVSSIINPEKVAFQKSDADGNITSGFYYDTEKGEFKFFGSGEFRSSTISDSYIRVEGNELVLCTYNLDKVRVGAQRGTSPDGSYIVDYPFILLGNADSDNVGLVKKFYNGMWYGNSAPKDLTGNFEGCAGASGLFVNTDENKAYVVHGTEFNNLYTGSAIARFG